MFAVAARIKNKSKREIFIWVLPKFCSHGALSPSPYMPVRLGPPRPSEAATALTRASFRQNSVGEAVCFPKQDADSVPYSAGRKRGGGTGGEYPILEDGKIFAAYSNDVNVGSNGI